MIDYEMYTWENSKRLENPKPSILYNMQMKLNKTKNIKRQISHNNKPQILASLGQTLQWHQRSKWLQMTHEV